jgi:hypothetical protein
MYATFEAQEPFKEGAAQATVCIFHQANHYSIFELPIPVGEAESFLRAGNCTFTLKMMQPTLVNNVWQPRTERGRRLLALRQRIVAAGTNLVNVDQINDELSVGRRHDS